ncbi:GNAT family N-acetyltransferase [Modestobacter muralis]|uniref:GNAT family N-acetyltransferase n=1 Tax=Modestobacter muralis TaxID=1608614 RepID=A0A6P0H9Z6_9ACTN|nr:GNAT family N-acetyltransferase [Modestobacter muralis]NEN52631.1 GNAT family N-acetyltransferase [Modestobacter muralis]
MVPPSLREDLVAPLPSRARAGPCDEAENGSYPALVLTIDRAVPADFPRIAELTVGVYEGEDLVSPEYVPQLADVAGRADRAELLVARDVTGRIVGSVALVLAGDFGEVTRSPDEAAFRMLAVDADVRGQGVGEALVRTCLDRARAAGRAWMVLSTGERMTAAHRLYERLGFQRVPERDWAPRPGVDLRVYALQL